MPLIETLRKTDFNSIRNNLALGISILLMLIYFSVIYKYTINIPFWDDYDISFAFLDQFLAAEGFWEKIKVLFQQDNEHRIVTYRLVLLLEYFLFGSINFKHIMLFGGTGIIVLWLLFLKVSQLNLWYFLPISLFLLMPIDRIIGWQVPAFVNIYIIVFALLSLYFLQGSSTRMLMLALLFAFLAVFTNGNGLLLFPAGILQLIILRPLPRHKLGVWIGGFILCTFFYFWDYQTPSSRTSIIEIFFSDPLTVFAYPFVFIGSIFKSIYNTHIYANPILGGLILTYTAGLIIFKWKYFQKNPMLLGSMLFLLFTIVVAALTRAEFGIGQATTRRYKIITAVFLILLYIASAKIWGNYFKTRIGIILLFSVFFYYFRLDDNIILLKEHRQKLTASFQYFKAGTDKHLLYPAPKMAGDIMRKNIANGHFKPPLLDEIVKLTPRQVPKLRQQKKVESEWEIVKQTEQYLSVKGWAFLKNQHTTNLKIFLILKSDDQSIMFETRKILRKDLNAYMISNYQLENAGFELFLLKDRINLPVGTYQLGLFLDNGNGKKAIRYLHNYQCTISN